MSINEKQEKKQPKDHSTCHEGEIASSYYCFCCSKCFCSLGFIPLLIFWAKRLASNQRMAGNLVLMSFLLFVFLASFSIKLIGSTLIVVIIYLFFSIVLMISPIFFPKYFEKPAYQAIASEK